MTSRIKYKIFKKLKKKKKKKKFSHGHLVANAHLSRYRVEVKIDEPVELKRKRMEYIENLVQYIFHL